VAGFCLLASILILLDELWKEAYVFDPADLFNPMITHEKLFIAFLIAGLIVGLRRKS